MRVLHRIVRVDSTGLKYEADTRHAELVVKSMGLEVNSKSVATPGIKKAFEDGVMDLVINDDIEVTSLAKINTRVQRIKFSDNVETVQVVANSDAYPIHPRTFVFG